MARVVRTEVDVIDDLDGKPIDVDDAARVEFAVKLPGARKAREYILDLRPTSLAKFEKDLLKYTDNAQEAKGGNVVTRTPVSSGASGASKEQLQAIRDWATQNGYAVSDRGRIAKEIRDAYDAAH